MSRALPTRCIATDPETIARSYGIPIPPSKPGESPGGDEVGDLLGTAPGRRGRSEGAGGSGRPRIARDAPIDRLMRRSIRLDRLQWTPVTGATWAREAGH